MSYVNDNLLPNEKIYLSASISPAIFIRPILVFILVLLFILVTQPAISDSDQFSLILRSINCFFSAIFIFSTLMLFIEAFTIMKVTEFAVTNKRIIAKTGFIRRRTIELLLTKVESVGLRQNALGRIFNFGTIVITGTGGTRQGFRAIRNPLHVKNKIYQIIEYVNAQGKKQP